MIVAFGIAFEFPVMLDVPADRPGHDHRSSSASGGAGRSSSIFMFAAVITPSQDPYSLFFMAVPMYIFYEACILIGRILKR